MRRVGLMAKTTLKFSSAVIAANRECYAALSGMLSDDVYHSIFMDAARSGILPQ